MKNLFALIPVALLLSGCLQSAQTNSSTPRQTSFPVALVRQMPPASLRAMFSSRARGPLTIAYKAAGDDGKDVWLLLFERVIPAKNRPIGTRFKGYAGSKGPVTLLVVAPYAPTPQKKWSVVREMPLGYVNKLHPDYISLRWLEPAKRKGPVLIFRKLSDQCDGAEHGVTAFSNGWNQPNNSEQIFCDGGNYDVDSKVSFSDVDEGGFLCVTESITDCGHDQGPDTYRTKYHDWDGKTWVAPPNGS